TIFYRALMVGFLDKMISDTVSMSYGYIQIHQKGYWENRSVDNTLQESTKFAAILDHDKRVTAWAPRLESFALASAGENTRGMMVLGIDPAKEDDVSGLSKKIIAGSYLSNRDKGILLGQGLASYLKVKVNDTAVLVGQGYHGELAAGKYAVKGIVKLGLPEMNDGMAWLQMAAAQDFLSTGKRYTSISVMMDNRNKTNALKQKLIRQTKGLDCEVMTWQEMLPELDQFFNMEMAGDYGVMAGILYLVIAFGIFGAILMMLNERIREFGILIAIGMKKRLLAGVVVMEMMLMSITGTLCGIVIAYPVVLYFRKHSVPMSVNAGKFFGQFNIEPIIKPSVASSNFIIQGYIVLCIAMVLSLYAIFKIHKIKVIEAINS